MFLKRAVPKRDDPQSIAPTCENGLVVCRLTFTEANLGVINNTYKYL